MLKLRCLQQCKFKPQPSTILFNIALKLLNSIIISKCYKWLCFRCSRCHEPLITQWHIFSATPFPWLSGTKSKIQKGIQKPSKCLRQYFGNTSLCSYRKGKFMLKLIKGYSMDRCPTSPGLYLENRDVAATDGPPAAEQITPSRPCPAVTPGPIRPGSGTRHASCSEITAPPLKSSSKQVSF